MFSFFRKKQAKPEFRLHSPDFSIVPDTPAFLAALTASGIEYETVTDGYVRFAGKPFSCDIPLMIGVHYAPLKVRFIEIFRPLEYYQAESYDINASFRELSAVLKKEYGVPLVYPLSALSGFPREQWYTPKFSIDHYIMDRFGPEEHLHIYLQGGSPTP